MGWKMTIDEATERMERDGGSLFLSNCTSLTALPEGLAVGGWLDLSSCTSLTALPEGLAVGGSLWLSGCTGLTALPENLAVGGSLDLSGCTGLKDQSAERRKVRQLVDGEIVPGRYIYADGQVFPYSGRSHKLDGYTVYVGKIPGHLLVSDGQFWAHCKSAHDGIADILYKRAADRGAEQFRGLDMDKPYSVEELKTMYRVITGACRAGTEAFVSSIRDLKPAYTIREAIALTKGQYNSAAFERFFEEE